MANCGGCFPRATKAAAAMAVAGKGGVGRTGFYRLHGVLMRRVGAAFALTPMPSESSAASAARWRKGDVGYPTAASIMVAVTPPVLATAQAYRNAAGARGAFFYAVFGIEPVNFASRRLFHRASSWPNPRYSLFCVCSSAGFTCLRSVRQAPLPAKFNFE